MMSREEFRDFYERYLEFSIKKAEKIVRNREAARDIAQEVFVSFYRDLDRLDTSDEKKLEHLLGVSTLNKTRDYLRKGYVKNELTQMEGNESAVLNKKYSSVEELLLEKEKEEYLKIVFDRLRVKNQINYDIFVKVKIDEIPTEVVAEEYGITQNNVNNRIFRTKLWLKAEMDRIYGE